jgi:hypothetical protein
VLVPIALISALMPYAELQVVGATGYIYILREYPGQAVVAIAGSGAIIWFSVAFLRKPRRTVAWVVTVTCVVALFSSFAVFESKQSNAAPWSDDGSYSAEWYPADGGQAVPYRTTARTLGEDSDAVHVRRHGPWMPISALALVTLTLIGIFCSCRPVLRAENPIPALALSVCLSLPYLFVLLVIDTVTGGDWG